MAAAGHGVDGIGDEVGEGLAELAGAGEDAAGRAVLADNLDVAHGEAVAIEEEDAFEDVREEDFLGGFGVAVEVEDLLGDFADALEFVFGHLEAGAGLVVVGEVALAEVEEVGDGFEGVIDLVGDGAEEAADGDALLAREEEVLGLGELAVEAEAVAGRVDGAGDGEGEAVELGGGEDVPGGGRGAGVVVVGEGEGGKEGAAFGAGGEEDEGDVGEAVVEEGAGGGGEIGCGAEEEVGLCGLEVLKEGGFGGGLEESEAGVGLESCAG